MISTNNNGDWRSGGRLKPVIYVPLTGVFMWMYKKLKAVLKKWRHKK